jgi:adenylate cyclase
VRYVLEGSVRKAGQRLRITGQLVEAETGSHLWADRFDSVLEDVFDLQDRVTTAVAGAIEPSITQAEIRRANRKPTEILPAYDWLLRAIGEERLRSRDGVDRTMQMARRAIELDPHYAQAYAYLAGRVMLRKIYGWMDDEAAETAEGVRFAHLAVQLAPNDSLVLTEAALALGQLNRDLATAIPWLDRAIALNPNSAHAFGRGAAVRNFAGDYITAAEHADRAMRLSPFDPYSYVFSRARGISHFLQRQLPEAVAWLRKSAQENPRSAPAFLLLGSALAHAGQMEEARAAIRRLLELHPMSSVRWWRQHRRLHGTTTSSTCWRARAWPGYRSNDCAHPMQDPHHTELSRQFVTTAGSVSVLRYPQHCFQRRSLGTSYGNQNNYCYCNPIVRCRKSRTLIMEFFVASSLYSTRCP